MKRGPIVRQLCFCYEERTYCTPAMLLLWREDLLYASYASAMKRGPIVRQLCFCYEERTYCTPAMLLLWREDLLYASYASAMKRGPIVRQLCFCYEERTYCTPARLLLWREDLLYASYASAMKRGPIVRQLCGKRQKNKHTLDEFHTPMIFVLCWFTTLQRIQSLHTWSLFGANIVRGYSLRSLETADVSSTWDISVVGLFWGGEEEVRSILIK